MTILYSGTSGSLGTMTVSGSTATWVGIDNITQSG